MPERGATATELLRAEEAKDRAQDVAGRGLQLDSAHRAPVAPELAARRHGAAKDGALGNGRKGRLQTRRPDGLPRLLLRSIPRRSEKKRTPEPTTGRFQNAAKNRAELGQERAGARLGGSNAAFMLPALRRAKKQFPADR